MRIFSNIGGGRFVYFDLLGCKLCRQGFPPKMRIRIRLGKNLGSGSVLAKRLDPDPSWQKVGSGSSLAKRLDPDPTWQKSLDPGLAWQKCWIIVKSK